MSAEFSVLLQSTPIMATVTPCRGEDVVLAWVRQCRCKHYDCCFRHANHELRADEEFVLKAVQIHGPAVWLHAADELRRDKKVAMEAVRLCPAAIRHVLPEHAADKDVVMAAQGFGLVYVARELHGDKDVVLAAVERWGLDLHWATDELKADKDVVLAAVHNDGEALQYALPELKVGATEIYTTTVVARAQWLVRRQIHRPRCSVCFRL